MKLIVCAACKGEGYVKSTDPLADEDDMVVCPDCGGTGYIEEALF